MSQSPFPVFPGQGWSVFKIPRFSTQIQTTASGRELRAALNPNAIYDFRLTLPLLRDDTTQELRTMLGFFLQRQGAFDEFLLNDPTDNTVTSQYLGSGNGGTTIFRFARTLTTNVTEPVGALNGLTSITVGGVTKLPGVDFNYTGVAGYGGTNAVQFFTAPAYGANVYANFSYYFRVRFKQDSAEFENFAQQLWSLKQVDLVGIAP